MASQTPKMKIVLGTGNIGDTSVDAMARFDTPAQINPFLDAFSARGYTILDTARGYSPHAPGTCEPRLGAVDAGARFTIDTKVVSANVPHPHARATIQKSIADSLAALKVSQVDIEYLHRPDRTTPFEETCEAMDAAFREGKFKRFGLSNYSAKEVEEIWGICDRRGFVRPSVYQGQYNALVRGSEKDLFPALRRCGMVFYAWSPAAGGFFSGKHKNAQPGSRFDTNHRLGQIYSANYIKPSIETASEPLIDLAAKHGISGHAAALRWTLHHSALDASLGDAVIIGASSVDQLTANLDIVDQGPLPDEVAEAISNVYGEIEGDAASYHL